MFAFGQNRDNTPHVAIALGELHYSIAVIGPDAQLQAFERREFKEPSADRLSQNLIADIERLKLVGSSCQALLMPGQYQLLLMDALDLPATEMAKALRWRLKGLVDYPLNEIAIDLFPIPAHGVSAQRKKVFVAVTPLSTVKQSLDCLESAYLNVTAISIPELALRNIVAQLYPVEPAPVIVLSFEEKHCQLLLLYQQSIYLIRDLDLSTVFIEKNTPLAEKLLLEIRRSQEYCLSELKLPEPEKILFSPSFAVAKEVFGVLAEALGKELHLLDLTKAVHRLPALSLKEQREGFYSIGAALPSQFFSGDAG